MRVEFPKDIKDSLTYRILGEGFYMAVKSVLDSLKSSSRTLGQEFAL